MIDECEKNTHDMVLGVCSLLSVPPAGIALYPGQAQLLSCKHYYEVIPPLRSPGQPGDVNCTTQRVNYTDPFSNQTLVTLVSRLGLGSAHPGAPVFFLPASLPCPWCGPSPTADVRLSSGVWPWLARLHPGRQWASAFSE